MEVPNALFGRERERILCRLLAFAGCCLLVTVKQSASAPESDPRNLEDFWSPFVALIRPRRDGVSTVDGWRILGLASCLGLTLVCEFVFSVVLLLSLLQLAGSLGWAL